MLSAMTSMDLAHGLHRVGVEEHAALVTELADFGDGLQDADLVIRGHDRNQNGLVVDGSRQVVHVDDPSALTGR